MTIKTKEPCNPKGLHFVFKHICLKKKLGNPVFLLLESEAHAGMKRSSKFKENYLEQIHSHPHN